MNEYTPQPPPALARLDGRILQAVAVLPAGAGAAAVLVAWERRGDCWQQAFAAKAVVGRGGFVPPGEKCEGDGGTPAGVYPLGLVFGYAATADTAMPYRPITADDHWVDDPASPQYNQWVHGQPQAASWEDMLRPDGLYRHGIVVEYNTAPVVPGRGSAIFIHLWRGPDEPTSGCIGLAEADLLRLIAWLSPAKRPVVILSNQ